MPTELWNLVCTILRNHIKPGHSCEKTVNRLWTKGISEPRPKIRESGVTVYFEEWDLERLWTLIPDTDVTDLEPEHEGDPPIVVRWKGRDYRIDGRRRINQLKRRGENGPHSIIVVDVDG